MKYLKYKRHYSDKDTMTYVQMDPGTSPSKVTMIVVNDETGETNVMAGEAALNNDREWEFRVSDTDIAYTPFSISEQIFESTEQEFLLVMGVL